MSRFYPLCEGGSHSKLAPAAILAARSVTLGLGPSTITAVDHGIAWAEKIMQGIDRRWPSK